MISKNFQESHFELQKNFQESYFDFQKLSGEKPFEGKQRTLRTLAKADVCFRCVHNFLLYLAPCLDLRLCFHTRVCIRLCLCVFAFFSFGVFVGLLNICRD